MLQKNLYPKQDVFVIDEKLPWSIRSSNLNILSVLGVIVVIVYSTPLFGLVIIPIGAFYYAIQVCSFRNKLKFESIKLINDGLWIILLFLRTLILFYYNLIILTICNIYISIRQ